jgi:DNA-binding transcriptional MerR regulator
MLKSELARKIGVTVKTLMRWCKSDGILPTNDRKHYISADKAKEIMDKYYVMA